MNADEMAGNEDEVDANVSFYAVSCKSNQIKSNFFTVGVLVVKILIYTNYLHTWLYNMLEQ